MEFEDVVLSGMVHQSFYFCLDIFRALFVSHWLKSFLESKNLAFWMVVVALLRCHCGSLRVKVVVRAWNSRMLCYVERCNRIIFLFRCFRALSVALIEVVLGEQEFRVCLVACIGGKSLRNVNSMSVLTAGKKTRPKSTWSARKPMR